jgi:hypothetical protein
MSVKPTMAGGADHLQALAPGLVRSQHQRCRLQRLLHHRQLALVELEIDDLVGLGFLPARSAGAGGAVAADL